MASEEAHVVTEFVIFTNSDFLSKKKKNIRMAKNHVHALHKFHFLVLDIIL